MSQENTRNQNLIKSIQKRELSVVIFVRKHLDFLAKGKYMKEFIPVKNHSNVTFAVNRLLREVTKSDTK